jgi:hypothetical protein
LFCHFASPITSTCSSTSSITTWRARVYCVCVCVCLCVSRVRVCVSRVCVSLSRRHRARRRARCSNTARVTHTRSRTCDAANALHKQNAARVVANKCPRACECCVCECGACARMCVLRACACVCARVHSPPRVCVCVVCARPFACFVLPLVDQAREQSAQV